MTQETIKQEGCFLKEQKDIINNNFDEVYAAVMTGLTVNAADLAALGSAQGSAAPIVSNVVNATAADGTKGVVLPTATAGAVYFVYNSVATNGLPVYPASDGTINGGTGDAAVTIEGKTLGIFVGTSTANWAAIYTADS